MKQIISSRQALFTYFIIISLSIGLPNALIKELRQDFWQAIIIAIIMDVIIGWCLYKMGLKYPNQTIFQYSDKILGKYLGKICVLMFSALFVSVAVVLTMGLIDFFGSVIMPETPKYVFALLLVLVSYYAVYSGIEVIMRISELFGPFILGALLFVTAFNLRLVDVHNLRPMFQHSISEVVQASVLPCAWFGICSIMGILMAHHNNPKDMLKIKLMGVGLGILALTFMTFMVVMVIGVEISSEQRFSVFVLARMAQIGDFIERLEAFQVAAWTAGSFFIAVLFHYAGMEGVRYLFPKISNNLLNAGIAAIIFVFAIFVYPSSHDKSLFLREIFGRFAIIIEIGGVISLYLCHVIKQKIQKG